MGALRPNDRPGRNEKDPSDTDRLFQPHRAADLPCFQNREIVWLER